MKRELLISFLVSLILGSCTHNEPPKIFAKDFGCVNLIDTLKNSQAVSPADLATIQALFQKNNIPLDNLSFTYNGGYRIFAIPYVNGLPVFEAQIAFFFMADTLSWIDGINEGKYETFTYNNKDTTKILEPAIIRALFISRAKSDLWLYPQGDFTNLCLDVQFGYSLKGINKGVPFGFRKAWYVHPKDNYYPLAIISDGDGTILWYDNGIIN